VQKERKQIIIIGAGPAGLMAAEILSHSHNVCLYDKEKNIGQKFILAGKGGFNLTNSLQGEELTSKYSPEGFMNKALSGFDSLAFRQWLTELGVSTFVGSSGRVFPEQGIKPIDILNRIKVKLMKQGVQFHTQHEFVGFNNKRCVTLKNQKQEIVLEADYILFALGGASWPDTGSDGSWRTVFESMGIATKPFQSSNCGININWPDSIRIGHAGKPVKNIRLFVNDFEVDGEVVITNYGMEGNAVYRLVPVIRNMLTTKIPATIYIDFKPSNTWEQLMLKIKEKDLNTKNYCQFFNLTTVQFAIIKAYTSKDTFLSVAGFISSLKKLAIPVDSLRPVEEAISTIGGIDLQEVNDDFSLKKYPWVYVIGEMLDWDAPTGGFLLQGCISMGKYAAKSIMEK
jgi:uncharacterized flavoprotein (TIGR03862 family)